MLIKFYRKVTANLTWILQNKDKNTKNSIKCTNSVPIKNNKCGKTSQLLLKDKNQKLNQKIEASLINISRIKTCNRSRN